MTRQNTNSNTGCAHEWDTAKMSTFKGVIDEFPDIQGRFKIVRFQARILMSRSRSLPPKTRWTSPSEMFYQPHPQWSSWWTSHLQVTIVSLLRIELKHSNHVFHSIHCSPATKELLIRLERRKQRSMFANGITEAREQQYKYLKDILVWQHVNAVSNLRLTDSRSQFPSRLRPKSSSNQEMRSKSRCLMLTTVLGLSCSVSSAVIDLLLANTFQYSKAMAKQSCIQAIYAQNHGSSTNLLGVHLWSTTPPASRPLIASIWTRATLEVFHFPPKLRAWENFYRRCPSILRILSFTSPHGHMAMRKSGKRCLRPWVRQ